MKVQSIYTSKILKKGFEFAAENGALFTTTASLVLSTAARPIAIMAAPDTDKENRQYASAKSLASSLVGYFLMLSVSLPISNAIKKINKNPSKYLKETTIQNLQAREKALSKSKKYAFATQLFTLGLGALIAIPKSMLTTALIPPFMKKIFSPQKQETQVQKNKDITFTGLAKGIGKLIDTDAVQKLSNKFYNTNFEKNIIFATDIVSTGAFVQQTKKNKEIKENRKNALIYNSIISTGLCIAGTNAIDKLLNKSTEKFIKNFKRANRNSPKLDKYVEGIKITKPTLIMGGLYYVVIPFISTILADKLDKKG